MSRTPAIDAIRPAWQRSLNLISALAPLRQGMVFFIILAVEHPDMELSPFFDRWFRQPEWDSYDREWSALVFSPTVRLVSITVGAILGVTLLVFLLMFIFRAPFMRFDLIVGRRREVRELWKENGGLAFQWFLFGLCVGSVQQAVSGLIPHTSNVLWIHLKDFAWPSTVAIWYWITEDFLVPVLTLEGGTVVDAMKQVWGMLRPNLVGSLKYLAMKAVLVVFSSVPVVLLLAFEVKLLITPMLGLILRLLQRNSVQGVTHLSFEVVLAICTAFALSLFALLMWALVEGTISAFFGCYAVLFFADRYPHLNEILNDERRIPA